MKKEFIVYIALCGIALTLFGFEFQQYSPARDVKFASFEVSGIGELEINTSANVHFIPSEKYELKIEGDRSLVENLEVKKSRDKITIGIKKIYNPLKMLKLVYSADELVNIYVSAPDAKSIDVSNRHNFNISNYYENEDVAMITLKNPKLFNPENSTCEPA